MLDGDWVPVHARKRRDWDQVAQRLRRFLDENVPQVRDPDYVTAGEAARSDIRALTQGLTEAYRHLMRGEVAAATARLSWELDEVPGYLADARAVAGEEEE